MAQHGDRQFTVEWCSHCPDDGFGDADVDHATFEAKSFKTRAAARLFAKKIFPKDFFGSVRIDEEVFYPYDEADAFAYPTVGCWEAAGETEFLEEV